MSQLAQALESLQLMAETAGIGEQKKATSEAGLTFSTQSLLISTRSSH